MRALKRWALRTFDLVNIFLFFLETRHPPPAAPHLPSLETTPLPFQAGTLESLADATAHVFGMRAFLGTIALLGTAIPSTPWWPLPAFMAQAAAG